MSIGEEMRARFLRDRLTLASPSAPAGSESAVGDGQMLQQRSARTLLFPVLPPSRGPHALQLEGGGLPWSGVARPAVLSILLGN